MATNRLYRGESRHKNRESLPTIEKYRMQPGELTSSTWVIGRVIMSKDKAKAQRDSVW